MATILRHTSRENPSNLNSEKKRSNPHLDTYQRMESPYGLARQLDIAHLFAELYYKYGPVWTGFPWSLQQTKLHYRLIKLMNKCN